MEPQTTATSVARRLPGRRLLLAGLTAVALAVAVVTGVSANGGPGGLGGPGGGFGGGITVTAINGSQLTLATQDGWTRTVDATGVKVMNGTTAITLGDLKVGDEIRLAQSRNFDGSVTITEIDVVAPHVEGTVSAIDGTTLTVRQDDGTTKTVTLTDTTSYTVNGTTTTRDGLVVGMDVRVQGTANADGSFTATSVATHPAGLGGTVKATTADSITVSDASGATATIKVSASTTYHTASGTGTLADVTVGAIVRAEGTRNADGSLTATTVRIGTDLGRGFGFGGPGDGFGGPGDRGGHGRGPGGMPGSGSMGMPGTAAPSASPSA